MTSGGDVVRSIRGAGLFSILAIILALSCRRPEDVGRSGAGGGTFRVALASDVVTLDPALHTDVYSDHVSSQIQETLFTVDFELRIVPLLAERLEQSDDRTYVVTLRRGVRFHNGDPLTANDVVFSLQRVVDPTLRSPRAGRLAEPLGQAGRIVALDRDTVQITLTAPYAPFLERLTQPYSAILNRRAVTEAGDGYGRQPVGTGPFKFVEWKTGEAVTLERNAEYWGIPAHVDRLVFKPIPDNATRVASLEAGEVDHLAAVPVEEVPRLREDPRFTTQVRPAVSITFLGFNTSRGPLSDPLLRQAIASVLDRDELVRTIYAGTGQQAVSALDPASWAFEPDVEVYRPDVVRARELLARSSCRGEELGLAVNQAGEARHTAERIQGVLNQELGLPVRINVMEWGAYLDYLRTGDRHQMYLITWSGGADPDSTLFPLFHSKNWGAAGNRAWYRNERVDALLEMAQSTVDQQDRAEHYREAQRLIARDVPILPVRHGVNSVASNVRVHGFQVHPVNRAIYSAVSVD